MTMSKLALTPQVIQSMLPARVHHDPKRPVSSMTCFAEGSHLAVATDDDTLLLYNFDDGELVGSWPSKKYGVCAPEFTHDQFSIVCASRCGFDEAVRWWNLPNNKFLAAYHGHRDRVTCVSMAPVTSQHLSDQFVSSSKDGTIRFWDLNAPLCQGMIRLPDIGRHSAVDFDPLGLVLFVSSGSRLYMYDTRKFDSGPFAWAPLPTSVHDSFTLSVSPTARHLLLVANSGIFLLNAGSGTVDRTVLAINNDSCAIRDASFSPDGRFMSAGTEEGTVLTWSVDKQPGAGPVATLSGHPGVVRSVVWSSRYGCFASACQHVAMWLPEADGTFALGRATGPQQMQPLPIQNPGRSGGYY